jgi:hypothetical protein
MLINSLNGQLGVYIAPTQLVLNSQAGVLRMRVANPSDVQRPDGHYPPAWRHPASSSAMARYILLGSLFAKMAVQVRKLATGRIGKTQDGGATYHSLMFHDMKCHFLHRFVAVSFCFC